jgi:hypothetical protein
VSKSRDRLGYHSVLQLMIEAVLTFVLKLLLFLNKTLESLDFLSNLTHPLRLDTAP